MPRFRVVKERDPSSIDYYWVEEFKWVRWRYVFGTYSDSPDMAKSSALTIIRSYSRYDIEYYNAIIEAPVKEL